MLSSRLIHIHVPKTAGQTIRLCFSKIRGLPMTEWMKTHETLSSLRGMIPKHWPNIDPEKVPAFVVVRNPWDWYVSRYFHVQRMIHEEGGRKNNVPLEHAGNSPEGFREHMRLLEEAKDGDRIVRDADGNVGRTGRNWWHFTLSEWHYHMVDGRVDHVARFENLAQDMAGIRRKVGISPKEVENATRIFRRQKVNSSKHPPVAQCYTPELAAKVAEWDKRYIEEFGYEPPDLGGNG